jgi:hypothetical protein
MKQQSKFLILKRALSHKKIWFRTFSVLLIALLYFIALFYLRGKFIETDNKLAFVRHEVNWLYANQDEISRRAPINFTSFKQLSDTEVLQIAHMHSINLQVTARNTYSFNDIAYKKLMAFLFELEIEKGIEMTVLDFHVQSNGRISGYLGMKNDN